MDYFKKVDVNVCLIEEKRREVRKTEVKLSNAKIMPFVDKIMDIFGLHLMGVEHFYRIYFTTYKDFRGDTIHFSSDSELQKAIKDLWTQNHRRQSSSTPLLKVYVVKRKKTSQMTIPRAKATSSTACECMTATMPPTEKPVFNVFVSKDLKREAPPKASLTITELP